MKIFITGGAGFIGSNLANYLVNQGSKVWVIDNLSNGKKENLDEKVTFIGGDLTGFQLGYFDEVKPEVVFHLAAQTSGVLSFKKPYDDMYSHVVDTFIMLQESLKHKVKHFIYTSSTTVYGDCGGCEIDRETSTYPQTYYATGKLAAEKYVQFFNTQGLSTTIYRLPNVYGPMQNLDNMDQGMVSIFLKYFLDGGPIMVKGGLDRERDFIYIDDVVNELISCILHSNCFGKIFNLVTGNSYSVLELIGILGKTLDRKEYTIQIEGGTPGDQYKVKFADGGRKDFINLNEGIKRMVEYYVPNMRK